MRMNTDNAVQTFGPPSSAATGTRGVVSGAENSNAGTRPALPIKANETRPQAALLHSPSAARPLSRARSNTVFCAAATLATMSCDHSFSAACCMARP